MAVKVRNVAGKWFGEGGGGEMPGGTGDWSAHIFAARRVEAARYAVPAASLSARLGE